MSSNIHIVNLAENYARPEVLEDEFRGFVLNGKNNTFFQTLISAYKGSVTHSSICNSYTRMVLGRGLGIKGEEKDSPKNDVVKEIISKKDDEAMTADFIILGAFAGQVHRESGDKSKIAKIEHLDVSKLAPSIRNDKGQITSYWYCYDWEDEYKYRPVEYPAFGFAEEFGDDTKPEVFVCQPYEVGSPYFSDPKWIAALQTAQLEEEISNFNITHIKRGLSFGSVIGVPNSATWSDQEKKQYAEDLKKNGQGSSNAGATNVIFLTGNDPINISNVENNTSHKQWALLTEEAKSQILTAHGCMSPTLIGMPPSTGFSSSAEEMEQMFKELNKAVIIPIQEWKAECLSDVLQEGGFDLDLQYYSLISQDEKKSEETNNVVDVEKTKQETLSNNDLAEFIANGEVIDRLKYDVIQEIEVDYNEELELDNVLQQDNIKRTVLKKFINLVSTGIARPNAKSEQDSENIIIRYKYVGNPNPERPFCQAMMNANKVYRKEDIEQLDNKVVNSGWGPNGVDTYSIWLYKGGGNCHHKWNRVIYLKKGQNVDVNSPLAEVISTSEARRKGYSVPTNDSLVSIEPRNMVNNGFLKPR